VNLIKGASVLAARIAEVQSRPEDAQLAWPPPLGCQDDFRCVVCGGPIADILASLGSLRCHDCPKAATPENLSFVSSDKGTTKSS